MSRNEYTDPDDPTKAIRYTSGASYLEDHPPFRLPCEQHAIINCATCRAVCWCGRSRGDGHTHPDLPPEVSDALNTPREKSELEKLEEEIDKAEHAVSVAWETADDAGDELANTGQEGIAQEFENAARETAQQAKDRLAELKSERRKLIRRDAPKRSWTKRRYEAPEPPLTPGEDPVFDVFLKQLQKICDKASWRWCFRQSSESFMEWNERRADAESDALVALIEPETLRKLTDAPDDVERRKLACTIAKRRCMNAGARGPHRREMAVSRIGQRGNDDYDPDSESVESQSISSAFDSLQDWSQEDSSHWLSKVNEPEENPELHNYFRRLRGVVDDAIFKLDREENWVVNLHYGLWYCQRSMSYADVPETMNNAGFDNLTVRQIKYIMKSATQKLQKYLADFVASRPPTKPDDRPRRINQKGKMVLDKSYL